MSRLLIRNGTIANENERYKGYILIENERIAEVGPGDYPSGPFDGTVIDAAGLLVLPGVIDDQVHFREPGLTYKADIGSESAAAVAGGVTSFMDMPNVKPPSVSRALLEQRFERAAQTSSANYSFYLGATNDNLDEIRRIDPKRICGVKLFMGSSTGNMLVDDEKALAAIFAESPVLVATHCEDEATIRNNMELFRAKYGDHITASMHPLIRSAEACYRSTSKAVGLAQRYGTDLHVLHLSTARELSLFEKKPLAEKKITNEVCVHHLWFCDADYAAKGNWIKWHAPHLREEKERPYLNAPSGGPLIQHSLTVMLELAKQGVCTVEQVVEKMCHAPAVRFRIHERGFLRPGFFADLVLVDPNAPWTVAPENILYKCGWSPFEGTTFSHRVVRTLVNGKIAYENGRVDPTVRGRELAFDR